jgi:hypothetical protein
MPVPRHLTPARESSTCSHWGATTVFVAKVLPPDGVHSPSQADPSLPPGPGTLDVNGDILVSALDVLLIVNLLNAPDNVTNVVVDQFNSALDVNLDQLITPLDALVVVNSLNSTLGRGRPQFAATCSLGQ